MSLQFPYEVFIPQFRCRFTMKIKMRRCFRSPVSEDRFQPRGVGVQHGSHVVHGAANDQPAAFGGVVQTDLGPGVETGTGLRTEGDARSRSGRSRNSGGGATATCFCFFFSLFSFFFRHFLNGCFIRLDRSPLFRTIDVIFELNFRLECREGNGGNFIARRRRRRGRGLGKGRGRRRGRERRSTTSGSEFRWSG